MKLEGTIHCEGPECNAHQHVGALTMAEGKLPPGWVTYTEYGDAGLVDESAFCHGSCALRWLANSPGSEPPEVIPFGEGEV